MRLILAITVLVLALTASAAERITATVTFTNAPTTNGMTFTVNGSTRTWTNTVFVSGTQILTNLLATGSKTNFYRHVGLAPFSQVVIQDTGPTNVTLTGNSGVAMAVSASAGYVSIVLSTQTVSSAVDVRVPYTVEAAAQQTNIWSLVGAALNFQGITNPINEASQIATNLVGRTNAQTITGVKTMTSPILKTPILTNGVNYGDAFASPGSASGSDQFGGGATASGASSTAVGRDAIASGPFSIAAGNSASATKESASAFGYSSAATGTNATAIGAVANATKTNSTAIGAYSFSDYTNSTALGFGATTTADNQTMLGSSSVSTVVNSYLSVLGGLTVVNGTTNMTHRGQNTFPAGADVTFARFPVTSLANGVNAAVPVGTNVFIEVSGPSSAFTIDGIANGRDGKIVYIINQTGFDMGIAHQSGSEGTAANRIITMTGATRTATGNGAATLIYSGSASRWILIGIEQ